MARPLRRRRKGRWIGGVCAGVAGHFGWPVWAVRVIWFVVAAIPVLPGLPAYLVLWLLVPLEDPYRHDSAVSR